MIDSHIHVAPPRLPGVGPLHSLLQEPADVRAEALKREMQAAGITQALAMGHWGVTPDDPLGVLDTLQVAALVPGLHAIGVADPTHSEPEHLQRVDAVLTSKRVRALKGYLGYLPFAPMPPATVPITNWLPNMVCLSSFTPAIPIPRRRNCASPNHFWSTKWRSIIPTCVS